MFKQYKVLCLSKQQQQCGSKSAIVVGSVLFVILSVLCSNVQRTQAAAVANSTKDECGHTLTRPDRYDFTFLKKVFKHWNPFSSRPRFKMQFFLFKRNFKDCGREIELYDEESLKMSEFNASHQTRFIIHGWMTQSKNKYIQKVKNAYLTLGDAVCSQKNETNCNNNGDADNDDDDDDGTQMSANYGPDYTNEDFNVIVADWSVLSSNVNYFSVVEKVDDLGRRLADFLLFLHGKAQLQFDDVYLIGHSLGAQISGYAGKLIQPHLVNTIYALDPAGVKFRNVSIDERLDATDAKYVESIQTSINFGLEEPVGHASFYPNFGHDQSKCYKVGCSHSRSHDYFAESLTSRKGFWGVLSQRQSKKKWILSESGVLFRMGGEPSTPKQGIFYVKTNAKPPYALGKHNQTIDE